MIFLTGNRSPVCLGALAMLLALSALWVGLQWDDYVLKLSVCPLPQYRALIPDPLLMFSFGDGDSVKIQALKDAGWLPWWTPHGFKMSFFRPLAAVTHWLDFTFWPDSTVLMHAHSLMWLGFFVSMACCLYRRLMGINFPAGLAGLLFAVDDAHGVPAGWLANRNALIASFFGFLTIFCHDRWRKQGRRADLFGACLFFLAGLLAGEIALATVAYLLAYALFLDRGSVVRRLAGLIPYTVVGLGWLLFYRSMGFGTWGSGWYVDPGANPFEYLKALIERGPILLFGQLGFLPSDLYVFLSNNGIIMFWLLAVSFLACFAWFVSPVLRQDRMARFFAAGMALSILPIATTFPFDRLLTFVGFGAAGLLAQVLTRAALLFKSRCLYFAGEFGTWPRSDLYGRIATWRIRVTTIFLFVVHLIVAPLVMPIRTFSPAFLDWGHEKTCNNLVMEAGAEEQTSIFVNGPCAILGGFFLPLLSSFSGVSTPMRNYVLAPGFKEVAVYRQDENTLAIRPENGFLDSPMVGGSKNFGLLSVAHMFQHMDRTFRDGSLKFSAGDRFLLEVLQIEVGSITLDGRPVEVLFHFHMPLEDPSLKWYKWREGCYVPFELPPVGVETMLSAPVGPFG